MGSLQASLLLLVSVALAEAQWPGWDRWRQYLSSGMQYPQNQGQAFWPPGPRTMPQDPNRFGLNRFVKPTPASVLFHPRALGHKSAVGLVQTPLQDPVQRPGHHVVQDPVQRPGHHVVQDPVQRPLQQAVQDDVQTLVQKGLWSVDTPVQSLSLPSSSQSVWNLPQNPVPVPAQSPAVAPVQGPIQGPLPVWNSDLTNDPNSSVVPVQDLVHPVPVQSPVLTTGLNPPVWNLVPTSMPAPVLHQVLTNGLDPVFAPVQDPAQNPLPGHAQNPALTPNVAPVHGSPPVHALSPVLTNGLNTVPVYGFLPMHAQSPMLTNGLNPVPVPAPVHGSPPVHAQSPMLTTDPNTMPVPAPVHGSPPVHAQSPVLTNGLNTVPVPAPVHESPPVHAQSPMLTTDPNTMPVPAPVHGSPPVHAQSPVLTNGLNTVPVHGSPPVHAQSPVLTNGLNAVPVHGSPPVHAQSPVLTNGLNAVPVHGSPPVHAQSPVLTNGLNAVPVHGSPPVHAQSPVLTNGLNAMPVHGSPPVHAQSPVLTNGLDTVPVPVPVYESLPVSVWNPAPSGLNSVLLSSYQDSPPVPAQSPALTSGPSTLPMPVAAPVHGLSQVPAQNPALTGSLNPLLMPAQNPIHPLVHLPAWDPANAPSFSVAIDPLQTQAKMPPEPLKKLTWQFPKAPARPQQPPVHFDLRPPTPAHSVAAACGESVVHVEVKQDLFETGHLVSPSSLTLGGCAAVGHDSAAHVLIFQSELQACGSVVKMTEDDLIYSFNLLYNPEPLPGTPIVRSGATTVLVECHYSRKHNVSSNSLVPFWVPYAATEVAEEHLVSTLKLMTDDWKFERPSNQYYFGDFMNIEASLTQFNHVPLRVFVDSCVATAVPDVNAGPKYSFIENHGCLIDAKITGSSSHFMPRVQGDKLQFRLEVFKFEQDNSSLIYITCSLKGSTASHLTDAEHKACSYTANGWVAADGDNQACSCCDTNCNSRKGRSVTTNEGLHFEAEVSLGPILVMDDDEDDKELLIK